jgi:hypothetical protein
MGAHQFHLAPDGVCVALCHRRLQLQVHQAGGRIYTKVEGKRATEINKFRVKEGKEERGNEEDKNSCETKEQEGLEAEELFEYVKLLRLRLLT